MKFRRIFVERLLKVSDISQSWKMNSLIITFSLPFFFTLFFQLKQFWMGLNYICEGRMQWKKDGENLTLAVLVYSGVLTPNNNTPWSWTPWVLKFLNPQSRKFYTLFFSLLCWNFLIAFIWRQTRECSSVLTFLYYWLIMYIMARQV